MAVILVVDDRPTNLEYLTTLIGYTGHKVIEAADGAVALELARSRRPDLLITDILMPTMNGYELVEQLRRIPEFVALPVIFYTATYRTSEAERLAAACGVTLVLSKPSEPQVILHAIDQALGRKTQAPAAPAAQPLPPAPGTARSGIGSLFEHYLGQLDDLIGELPSSKHDRSRPDATAAERIRGLGQRMHRMARLFVELNAERDPLRILEWLLAAVVELTGADDGAVCAIDARDPACRHIRVAGQVRPEWYSTTNSESVGLLRALVREGRILRLQAQGSTIDAMGLVAGHPPVSAFLGAPMTNRTETIGWIYATRRPGAPPFDDEDEFLIQALASTAALLYENAHIFDIVQRHAADLRLEVTERRHAEAQVRRLNRLLGVLISINNLIVRTRDRDKLFEHACRILVEQGQYAGAWIALLGVDRLQSIAWAGDTVVRQPTSEAPRSLPIISELLKAIEGGRPYICNDLASAPLDGLLPIDSRNTAIRAVMALPISVDEHPVGVLTVYSAEPDVFTGDEVRCLEELSRDIAYAMAFIAREERLGFLARHDSLTGLANRALLEERLVEHIADARRDGKRVGLLVLDIDRFKAINDRLGYEIGDDVLRHFAGRLTGAAGEATRLARISGDRYAIIVPGLREAGEIAKLLRERIGEVFDEPLRIGNEEIRLNAKIGIALYPDDGDSGESLIRNAEAALKRAKATGERYLFYTQQMSDAMKRRITLEGRLEQALARKEFVLHYQPQIELRTAVVRGAEALIRWNNPDLGLVPPGHFIPLLEENGLITEVGLWVIQSR
jgi:diguanylate cyclase (GGDEF)-like protein